eukprot:TRINITY_DN7295_c0_g1_i2.p1 TRINITY_DN7295_c0_g1~~TRINITY_DN7295_c0_g1_i2.p1  ORF type:complete len:246 (-),score=22.59 TRINITY_DN7295_c0_g1_i2:752-1489(-)
MTYEIPLHLSAIQSIAFLVFLALGSLLIFNDCWLIFFSALSFLFKTSRSVAQLVGRRSHPRATACVILSCVLAAALVAVAARIQAHPTLFPDCAHYRVTTVTPLDGQPCYLPKPRNCMVTGAVWRVAPSTVAATVLVDGTVANTFQLELNATGHAEISTEYTLIVRCFPYSTLHYHFRFAGGNALSRVPVPFRSRQLTSVSPACSTLPPSPGWLTACATLLVLYPVYILIVDTARALVKVKRRRR